MVRQHTLANEKGYWKDRCIDLDFKLMNRFLDCAIILDALAGGADKSVEEQRKDFQFIIRKEGERRSDFYGFNVY